MRKKILSLFLALATSVGMMYATSPAVNGKLPGAFSVASGTQVYFSQGNLQYQASTNTWRFAEKQWNFVGGDPGEPLLKGNVSENEQLSNNSLISSSYNGWIDLFGWATSGNSASGTAYQPWANSANASEYGPAIISGEWTTANSDWGINAISNGGNTANAWRTLTQAEWNYLLMEREGNRFAYAKLETPSYSYVYGLIILPDDWNTDYYTLGGINEANYAYNTNSMTTATWESDLEAHGAVFLPVTGIRGDENAIYGLDGDNSKGLYWSSTAGELHDSYYDSEMEQQVAIDVVNAAYGLRFSGGWFLQTSSITSRASGIAVRLVAATPGGSSDPDPQDPQPSVGDYTISLDIAENADKVTLSAASADAGETITVTPAEGYQITSFTATSGSGNIAVRFTSDPDESVNDAEPQYVTLPHEFTADVIPGEYGADFQEIEGGEGQIEYVGMNAENDQLTFRVNGTFSGTAAVHYLYKEGGWVISAIRVICAAEGGGSEVQSVKNDVTGAYSFTMPAGNVTVTATVEAVPTPENKEVATNADPQNPTYYYSTFYHSTQKYALTDDGTVAFVADLSGVELVLTEIAKGTQVLPANTAVILRKSNSAEAVILTPTDEEPVTFSANNSLEGVDENTAVTSIDGLTRDNCFVLSGVDGVGFYKINSDNLAAHKAYVRYNGALSSAPKRMRFVFETATGVEQVPNNQVQRTKVVENGVLYIMYKGTKYNVQGQIVK